MAQRPAHRPTSSSPVLLGSTITTTDLVSVARHNARVSITPAGLAQMKRARAIVEHAMRDDAPHYGINTGFGSLAKQRINAEDLATLQRNLVRSHSAGVGTPLATETVRGMMLLLAASLCRGMSGVRPIVAETLVAMLNKGVTPLVPSVGSVGASGDLAPLAAVALVAIGEGRATLNGNETTGAAALAKAAIKPLTLDAKEGLALINGTHLMAAEGALLVHDAETLAEAARVALAMSIDACRASHSFLDARLYTARNHPALGLEAAAVRALLEGSAIRESHLDNDPRVQDPYSLRAGVTVLGAAVDQIVNVGLSVEDELSAVTDNPLVFGGKDAAIVSGANFHGMPVALPLDILAIAVAHIAGISERRVFLMTAASEPEMRQRPYLVPATRRPGLQSGLMIAQYTAAAAVNELVGLAAPASVANVSTCAGMEDYNSFGPRSAAKARRAIELARYVVSIELLCAAQGIEAHRPLKSGAGVERAIKTVRSRVKTLADDRELTTDVERLAQLIATGQLTPR